MYSWLRPLLFRMDPEEVHGLVTRLTLPLGWQPVRRLLGRLTSVGDPRTVGGLTFPNAVGLAAGFDKEATWMRVAEALGFGHIEVGAVTPRPQAGHPRPRLFRLPAHQALRNRMGFNNPGSAVVGARLRAFRSRRIVVGVNLGKNSDTPLDQAVQDYLRVIDDCEQGCDFFTLNVSSPNTEGLRSLSQGEHLAAIVAALRQRTSRPLWLKLSPDESEATYEEVAQEARRWGLTGVIFSNTTVRRDPPLQQVDPLGGVSGRPLLAGNLHRIKRLRALAPELPLIGVGGILAPEDAQAYLRAGASLVQVYTGFVYGGPGFARALARAAASEGAVGDVARKMTV